MFILFIVRIKYGITGGRDYVSTLVFHDFNIYSDLKTVCILVCNKVKVQMIVAKNTDFYLFCYIYNNKGESLFSIGEINLAYSFTAF